MRASFVVLVAASAVVRVIAGCGGPPRDVAAASRDVHVASPPDQDDGYVYVARRPLGVVAVADARGLDPKDAARIADRVADALARCAADLARDGKLVEGAVRIAAHLDEAGNLAGMNVKTAPGAAVAANALLCVVAPFKLLTFPPGRTDGGTRGIALEATWGRSLAASTAPPASGSPDATAAAAAPGMAAPRDVRRESANDDAGHDADR